MIEPSVTTYALYSQAPLGGSTRRRSFLAYPDQLYSKKCGALILDPRRSGGAFLGLVEPQPSSRSEQLIIGYASTMSTRTISECVVLLLLGILATACPNFAEAQQAGERARPRRGGA